MYRFLLLLSLAAPLWAQQDCDPAINDAVADHLNLSTDKLAERTVLAACQPNPDEPAETLTAQAIVGVGYTKDNYNRSLRNDNPWQLLVARVRDGQVQSASSSDEVIDMITDIGNLSLGSTIYELSPDTHAFAVHFSSSAPGEERAIRGKNNELHLFGTIDGSLRHLAGFATDPWLSSTGDVYPLDPAVKAQCPSCTRQTARNFTINVQDSQHHGLADLAVSAELVASGDGGAADEEIIGRETVLLRFDGSSYRPVSDKWWLEEGLILHDRADDAPAAGAQSDSDPVKPSVAEEIPPKPSDPAPVAEEMTPKPPVAKTAPPPAKPTPSQLALKTPAPTIEQVSPEPEPTASAKPTPPPVVAELNRREKKESCAAAVSGALAKQLKISGEQLAARTLAADCRPKGQWRPEQVAAGAKVALRPEADSDEVLSVHALIKDGCSKDAPAKCGEPQSWQLLLSRQRDGQIRETFSSAETLGSARAIGDLNLDTSPYRLNHLTRGFGLAFNNGRRDTKDSGWEWHLFAPINGNLRHMVGFSTNPRGDRLSPAVKRICGQCRSQSADNFTVSVDGASPHKGFADLLVSAQLRGFDGNNKEYDLGRETVRLRFDGRQYWPEHKKWWLDQHTWLMQPKTP